MARKSKRQQQLETMILDFLREWNATSGHVGVIHLGALVGELDDEMTLGDAIQELDDIILDA